MNLRFTDDFEQLALKAIGNKAPELRKDFVVIISYLASNPQSGKKFNGKDAPQVGTAEYIAKLAEMFISSREPNKPEVPKTIPDDLVSLVLNEYFDVPKDKLETIKIEHQMSMAAENIGGDLLERYLNSVLSKFGWVWCSGSIVRAVDFIKPPYNNQDNWTVLQIKSRDNSENSSSSAIRNGTEILKWFRSFSKKSAKNWNNFPDEEVTPFISEDDFLDFCTAYLQKIRKNVR